MVRYKIFLELLVRTNDGKTRYVILIQFQTKYVTSITKKEDKQECLPALCRALFDSMIELAR